MPDIKCGMGIGFVYQGKIFLGHVTKIMGRSVEITIPSFPAEFSKSKLTVSKKELKIYVTSGDPLNIGAPTVDEQNLDQFHKMEMEVRHVCCSCPVCVPDKRMIQVEEVKDDDRHRCGTPDCAGYDPKLD